MFLWVNHFRFDWPCVLQPMTPGMSRWALKVLGHFFCFLFSWLSLFFLFRGGGGGTNNCPKLHNLFDSRMEKQQQLKKYLEKKVTSRNSNFRVTIFMRCLKQAYEMLWDVDYVIWSCFIDWKTLEIPLSGYVRKPNCWCFHRLLCYFI